MRRGSKILLWVVTVTLALIVALAVFGPNLAARTLKTQIEKTLGPESEVGEIVLGWSAIEIRNIRIRAPQGWPAEDTLRAARIVVEPDLEGLLSSKIHIKRIAIEAGYLSVLRSKDGRLHLLPSLLEKKTEKPAESASSTADTPVNIDKIELLAGTVEFFDASIRHPAHKLRIEKLNVHVDNLQLPELKSKTQLALDGNVKGIHKDGKIAIKGWMIMASKDSEIQSKLTGVDLLVLQPYLVKTTESGIKKGLLDLDMKSAVKNNQLKAPGTVTLTGLELSASGNSFMGLSRQGVIGALKNNKDQIVLHFSLEGNLADPKFSLNESFSRRLGAGMAEKLGLNLEGLTQSVGGAAQGVGGALRKIFGN